MEAGWAARQATASSGRVLRRRTPPPACSDTGCSSRVGRILLRARRAA